jgi:long-chain acyl-CoA synthetase
LSHRCSHRYYRNAEKTAEAIDVDHWLHSGDIGLFTPEGNVKIIDRKKNIFKLSQGEYIAVEKVENAYLKSPFVAQIFVYGDSLQSCLVAIVVPDADHAKVWATEKGLAGATLEQLVANKDFIAALQADMTRYGKEGQVCTCLGSRGFVVCVVWLDPLACFLWGFRS